MRLAPTLHAAALVTGLSPWLARRKPVYRILMLHGVDDLVLTPAAFEASMSWLARQVKVMPLGEMVAALQAGRSPAPGGALALTFDDGLRNQLDAAYPVLQRLGLPATYFICPELIDGRRWIWNQEARARLQSLDNAARADFARRFGAAGSDVEALIRRMKSLPLAERMREEAVLRESTAGYVPSDRERMRYEPLSWSDIERLDPALITIGSHTLTHPILTSLDDATLAHELAHSRRVLEQRLSRTVDLFCYPNGDNDTRVRDAVARVYRAAVTTVYGFVETHQPDLHRLARIPVTPSLPLLAWRMLRATA